MFHVKHLVKILYFGYAQWADFYNLYFLPCALVERLKYL